MRRRQAYAQFIGRVAASRIDESGALSPEGLDNCS